MRKTAWDPASRREKRLKQFDTFYVFKPKLKPKIKTEKDYLNTFEISEFDREYYETLHNYHEKPCGEKYGMDALPQEYICSTVDWHRKAVEQQVKKETLLQLLKEAINKLTPKQQAIINLHLQGLKQAQIAKKLNLCQTSIQKTLYGNWDAKHCKFYGGITKKLRKLMEQALIEKGTNIEAVLDLGFDEQL